MTVHAKCDRFNWLMLLIPLVAIGTSVGFADETIRTRSAKVLPNDPAEAMVAGIDRFLSRKLSEAAASRGESWKSRDDVDANLSFLKRQLGLEAERCPSDPVLRHPPLQVFPSHETFEVAWPVLPDPAPPVVSDPAPDASRQHQPLLWGDGLFWKPKQPKGHCIILLSHDGTPSLWSSDSDTQDVVMDLVVRGFPVLEIATLGHDQVKHGGTTLSRRELIHRSAFELGRTLAGYEIQVVQSAIDWLNIQLPKNSKFLVAGYGEGGRTALLSAAVDQRIDHTVVVGYFGPRHGLSSEPIERTIFGFSSRFDDSRLVAAIEPRQVLIQTSPRWNIEQSGVLGASPAVWQSPDDDAAQREFDQIETPWLDHSPAHCEIAKGPASSTKQWPVVADAFIAEPEGTFQSKNATDNSRDNATDNSRRKARRLAMYDRYNQALLAESEYERGEFINLGHSRTIADTPGNRLDTTSPAEYESSIERYRKIFRDEVIGWYDDPRLPGDARSTQSCQGEGWTGHDVMLDVFPDVFSYGVLLMPDDIKPGEKRPVVVCQHGLEGRPQDCIAGDHRAYHDFAAKLAQKGYIVFAPQNPYIGKHKFRTLQRKSYPLGKTLFSIIGAQHEQILRWLKSIPSVDDHRIAFYGLSYGGKSAMRLPALLPDYCLSICSADFNDWVWKNASTRSRYSYVGTGEYEIYEFGLGKHFNYAEMAALIAPRPFMVERGHHDGVGPDDRVAKEFAKVRYLYNARLHLPGRCEIEYFDGPHAINGKGTFEFLDRHLRKDAGNVTAQ